MVYIVYLFSGKYKPFIFNWQYILLEFSCLSRKQLSPACVASPALVAGATPRAALPEQGEFFVPLGAYGVIVVAPRGRPQYVAQTPAIVEGAEELEV